ncbi:hypothetical protein DM01DRAFT_1401818 [Hesseltinella vesiculosa]|uniref:Uncharacterized protein n=1 Tax=Hesseltinella vesiculosa TaxID=101127 RepID=A0A1X2GP96_9FUNG|nr:hypothetical protein DM01DRAFT_1401818 [Hesseltinella vesiculosa]
MARAGLDIWNTIYDTQWPKSLHAMAKITTYITCFTSCYMVLICIFGCWSIVGQYRRASRFLWWCAYLGTLVDVLNTVAYLSMIGFGMYPFIAKCAFGSEDIPLSCESRQCVPWKKCTRVWQLAMIWVASSVLCTFVLNYLCIYCLHVSSKKEPEYRPAYTAQPPMISQRSNPIRSKYESNIFNYDYNRAPPPAPISPASRSTSTNTRSYY